MRKVAPRAQLAASLTGLAAETADSSALSLTFACLAALGGMGGVDANSLRHATRRLSQWVVCLKASIEVRFILA